MPSMADTATQATPRVALYARVSSDEQREAATIRAQVTRLTALAAARGVEVVGEPILDDGVSGTVPMEKRPGGARLVAMVRAREVTAVWVYALDRLARTLQLLIDADKLFTDHGVALVSERDGVSTDTPTGRLLFHIMGSVAQWERENLLARTAGGRARVASDGKWLGGPVPFGYTTDDAGRLVPSARLADAADVNMAMVTEADVARELFERIAGGSTAQAEAQRLTAAGLRSEKRYQGGKRNGGNGRSLSIRTTWSADRIRAMVRNSVYRGEHAVGDTVREVPALVDRHTWERAGRQLTANQSTAKPERGGDYQYALRGFARCEACGAAMVGHSVRDARAARRGDGDVFRRYYVCSAAKQAPADRTDAAAARPCQAKHIRCVDLENAVLDALRPLVDRPAEAIVADILCSAGTSDAAQASERAALVGQVERLSKDRAVLLDLIKSGAADVSEIGSAVRDNRAKLTAAQDRLAQIDADAGVDGEALEGLAEAAVAEAAQASTWFDALAEGTAAREGREYVRVVRGLCSTWLAGATVALTGAVTVQTRSGGADLGRRHH